jgi:hypothetical protein
MNPDDPHDPDPHQNVMDLQHCKEHNLKNRRLLKEAPALALALFFRGF